VSVPHEFETPTRFDDSPSIKNIHLALTNAAIGVFQRFEYGGRRTYCDFRAQ
jgi:hypothetical protein